MLELRHFQYFVAVAEELHFTRAARKLGTSQPALSQQIKQLEARLGFALLDRSNNQVRLTPAGEAFLEGAYRTLTQAERTISAAARVHEGRQGDLHIGFLASFSQLSDLLSVYKQRFPNVTVHLHELTTAQQRAHFQDGLLDVSFARDIEPDGLLTCETLYQEPLCLAVSHDHPLASRASVTIQTLKDEPFLMFPKHLGPSLYNQIMQVCEQAGFSPRIVQEFVHMPTCLQLVSSGMGVALVPLSSCRGVQAVHTVRLTPEPTINLNMLYVPAQGRACLPAFLALARRTLTAPL